MLSGGRCGGYYQPRPVPGGALPHGSREGAKGTCRDNKSGKAVCHRGDRDNSGCGGGDWEQDSVELLYDLVK